GQIGVKSAPGKGSTFWFTAEFEKGIQRRKDDSAGMEAHRDANILVVDGVASVREVYAEYLQAWGLRFDEAETGEMAITMLRGAASMGAPFHAAIIDMQLPGKTDRPLDREIRGDPVLHDTAIVLAAPIGKRIDAVRFDDKGDASFLTKPVKKAQLRDCLKTVLATSEAPRGRIHERPKPGPGGERAKKSGAIVEPRLKVLLVEDNRVNRKVAGRMLEKERREVVIAKNGKEAVAAFEKEAFDVILMDIRMPEMDGLEATARIRELEEIDARDKGADFRKTPIIAVTANAMKGDREHFLAAGMDDYLSKPIKKSQLDEIIEKAM
ncbi:MAG: response regulator, partial [Desulfobacterales bacterium]|nr:response regulator [Desulfobacterales bacterium]